MQREDFERHAGAFADGADLAEVVFPWAVAEEGEFVLEPDFEVERGEVGVALLLEEARATALSTPPEMRTAIHMGRV